MNSQYVDLEFKYDALHFKNLKEAGV
jgi:hypothetical protein